MLGGRIIEMNLETLSGKLPCKLGSVNLAENSPKINDPLASDVLATVILNVSDVQMIHDRLDTPPVTTALALESPKGLD